MNKDQIVDIWIEDMSEDGAGIGKADGYPLFVKDAVVGDHARVKVIKDKKRYAYAKLVEVLEPSPDRVKPLCPVAGPCGGCQLQALSYDAQLAFKHRKVKEHLRRIGGFAVAEEEGGEGVFVRPVMGMDMPWCYRNKEQFPVGKNKDGKIVTGFYAGRTHSIIDTSDCMLSVPVCESVLFRFKAWMEQYGIEPYDEETGTGLVRHVLIRSSRHFGSSTVCPVINGEELPHSEELVKMLTADPQVISVCYNVNTSRGNVILGEKVVPLHGQPCIIDKIQDRLFKISPLSFYQVNPTQTERLYATVREFCGLTGEEVLWDLYCGIGTISLYLSGGVKQAFGVEIVPAAIEDARMNAEINGVKNVEFICGKAEEVLPEYYAKEAAEGRAATADIMIVDPPRKGCDKALLDTMLQMAPKRIIYVSCDSATLARDLKILCEGGYAVQAVQPVDMFPQTVHVETVCCLYRQKKKFISVPYEPRIME